MIIFCIIVNSCRNMDIFIIKGTIGLKGNAGEQNGCFPAFRSLILGQAGRSMRTAGVVTESEKKRIWKTVDLVPVIIPVYNVENYLEDDPI